MIFPARNLHLEWIFHGYVSHNQMVPENLHPMFSDVGHEVPEGPVVHASAAGRSDAYVTPGAKNAAVRGV